MILNLFALAFVLGITFMHSLFGLYSGIINVFCSITALAVAFGVFEPLNNLLTGQFHLHPSYTEPFALVLPFVVTLLVLRVLADSFLRGNVRVPMYLDWGGGAVCGFVNAQICVGVMVLGFLMLPFGGRVMQFSRQERDPENDVDPESGLVEFHRRDLWLRSDRFAVGLFNLLSGGSLRASTTFAHVYPDFPEWVFWTGNTVQHESLTAPIRDDKGDGFTTGLSVESWWRQAGAVQGRYRKLPPTRDNPTPPYDPLTYTPRPGHELLGVRVALRESSADRGGRLLPQHRFRPTMFRIVGDVGDEPRQCAPLIIGGADPRLGENLRIVSPDANFALPAQARVDLYFEVPEGFRPRFIEYRRHARAALTGEPRPGPPAERLAAAAPGEGPRATEGSGPSRFIDAIEGDGTGEVDRLPVALSSTKLVTEQVELSGDRFASGRVAGDVSALRGTPTEGRVDRFLLPEGRKMFQLRTRARRAQSLAGQVLNFVGSVTNQYRAVSSTGDTYPLAGYYALVKRDGQDFVELYYATDDPAFRHMLDFKTEGIRRDLQNQDDAVLGLIFLVPPGTCITGVQTQGGKIDFGQEYCVGQ